ncbi:MAG TPA: EscU/YscU/HrcU family type III secretion system export apparatus switch protein, partial [Myxococcaceae bacterium]|nr:EscU/YscU/HrcU family type III secretion system export apparatus switch protein [Myxococcaceae bacterium]
LPTEKKLEDARRRGEFPKSRVWTACATTFGGLAGCALSRKDWSELGAWAVGLWTLSLPPPPVELLRQALTLVVAACVRPLMGALVGALGAAWISVGHQFDPGWCRPQWERVNPMSGLRRVMSLKQLPERCRDLFFALVMAAFGWVALQVPLALGHRTLSASGADGTAQVLGSLASVLLKAAALLTGFGILDLIWARRRYVRGLMMTRDEVRREHREIEGDPHHRAARKAAHRQLLQGGGVRGVGGATAVVVNPTHLAVALRYDERECDAPYLVAKGREEDALRIRQEARRLGIPILKDVPLARGLYAYDVGEAVPEELYQAAAAVLRAAFTEGGGRHAL